MKNKIICISVLTCTLLMSGCSEVVQSTSQTTTAVEVTEPVSRNYNKNTIKPKSEESVNASFGVANPNLDSTPSENKNSNTGSVNSYGQTNGYNSTDNSITIGSYRGTFRFSDPKYDPSESGMYQNDYMQFFEISVENVSNTTYTLFANDFYLRDLDGKVYNLDDDAFFYFTGGPYINEKFRPNEKTTFTVAVENYNYDTLTGSILYWQDKAVCKFS